VIRINPIDTEYERACRAAYAREQQRKKQKELDAKEMKQALIFVLIVFLAEFILLITGAWQ
jgi:hypothetical protein